MNYDRRTFMKQAAAAALAGVAGGCTLTQDHSKKLIAGESSMADQKELPMKGASKPNILFIFVDQMRGDALGFAGNPIVKTPNLDKLAATGAFFPNTWCQNPVCVPSRCSVFTGQYPHSTGCKDNGQNWPEDLPTMATELKKAGYHLSTSGKIHFTPDLHAMRGFDQRSVVIDKGWIFNDDYQAYLKSKGLLETYAGMLKQNNEFNVGRASLLKAEDHIDAFVARKSIEFLRAADRNQPWFHQVGFPSPHVPTDPPEPWASMYNPDDMPVPPYDPKEYEMKPQTQKDQIGLRNLYSRNNSTKDIQRFLAHYYGLVSMIDKLVGDLVQTLKETNQLDNTLIIFGSDHGDHAGEHGTLFKSFALFEGQLRVPLILNGPGISAKGRIDAYAENVDIFPTMLEAAGQEIPWGPQGRSLMPLVGQASSLSPSGLAHSDRDGESSPPPSGTPSVREFLFAEYHYQKAIRKGRWKLIHYAGKPLGELYDLESDPHEAINLYDKPECREVREELKDLLLTHLVATEAPGSAYDANFANAVKFLAEPNRGSL